MIRIKVFQKTWKTAHPIRRRALSVKDFCISYMTSSKKIKIVKIIKQSYDFNTESRKNAKAGLAPPQFREVTALTSYEKNTEVQKEVSRKNDDLNQEYGKGCHFG